MKSTIILTAIACVLLATQPAQASCPGSDTVCHSSSQFFRKLTIRPTGGGAPDPAMSGAHEIILGYASSIGRACVKISGTFRLRNLYDEYAGAFVGALAEDSFVCTEGGADTVTVIEAGDTFNCDGTVLSGFNYGGNLLQLEGGGDADNLTGGTSNDGVCGMGGNDILNGWDGHDIIDGGSGVDVARGEVGSDQIWGGNSCDIILEFTAPADSDNLQGGANPDCVQDFTPNTVDCGSGSDYWYTGGGHTSPSVTCENEYFSSCSLWSIPGSGC